MEIQPTFREHKIDEIILMFRSKQINLEPGFQRRSVWTTSDRQRFIQSILEGYPCPNIFLYERNIKGKLIYDVIDGKQRLETIYMFTGIGRFKKNQFDVKLDMGEGLNWYSWQDLCRTFPDKRAAFVSYKIQTVEVSGDLSKIIELFMKINSTGKKLTSGEKRHARFYTSKFLKESEKLVKKYESYLKEQKILTSQQIDRMKGTELFAELLMSIHKGGIIDKKVALDKAIGKEDINTNTLNRLSREFVSTMNLLKRMFPNIKQTRFHNSVEFYTLFLLIWEMNQEKFILTDKKRNEMAFEMLRKLSTEVDILRDQLKKAKQVKPAQRVYSAYLLTVQGDTDSSATRQRRREIVKGLLYSLYDKKDDKRTFSAEQRRIIWNSDDKRVCSRCKKQLTWEDFSIDHIKAWSKGGKTSLKNAQLMCKRCNSKKGAK